MKVSSRTLHVSEVESLRRLFDDLALSQSIVSVTQYSTPDRKTTGLVRLCKCDQPFHLSHNVIFPRF